MSKLFTRASVSGTSLSGANLKASLVALWDALNSLGVTDSNRTTVSASATLLTTQCGILLADCSAGSVVLTLPTSGTSTDEAFYSVRRIDSTYANTLTVQRGGTDSVEGSTTVPIVIGCGGQVDVKMPGGATNWRVVNRGGGTQLAARETHGVPSANWLDNPDGEIYQRTIAATADDTYSEDRWYELTQTGTVTPSQLTAPEDGFGFGARSTQSQVTAQRFGRAQILEGKRTKKVRGRTQTFGGRFRLSTSANLRVAILAWTGTEDVVTSDVVNDWTSGIYTAANFFLAANLTVVAVGSAAMVAATARDVSITGQIPSNANNLIVVYWTEATAAQNVTLDAWGRRVVEGGTLLDYLRRSEDHELARCQRFFQLNTPNSGYAGTTTNLTAIVSGAVRMRAVPTLSLFNGTNAVLDFSVATRNASAVGTLTGSNETGMMIDVTVAATTAAKVHGLMGGAIAMSADL